MNMSREVNLKGQSCNSIHDVCYSAIHSIILGPLFNILLRYSFILHILGIYFLKFEHC